MSSSLTKALNKISFSDINEVGGKGVSLGELTKNNINVPPGFVILASTFEKFAQNTSLNNKIAIITNKISKDNMKSIQKISDDIQALILKTKMPPIIKNEIFDSFHELNSPLVAIRSSAVGEDSTSSSWAGQLKTYLNVNKNDLIKNVKQCWSSAFASRAIYYGLQCGYVKNNISIGIVVQTMIQSDTSGVAFTINPLTKKKDHILIEAIYGLGELLVSGRCNSDNYTYSKLEQKIIDKNIMGQEKLLTYIKHKNKNELKIINNPLKNKQKLSNKQIEDLALICQKIENYFGNPQDIEWAIRKNQLFIIQSRPITR